MLDVDGTGEDAASLVVSGMAVRSGRFLVYDMEAFAVFAGMATGVGNLLPRLTINCGGPDSMPDAVYPAINACLVSVGCVGASLLT